MITLNIGYDTAVPENIERSSKNYCSRLNINSQL